MSEFRTIHRHVRETFLCSQLLAAARLRPTAWSLRAYVPCNNYATEKLSNLALAAEFHSRQLILPIILASCRALMRESQRHSAERFRNQNKQRAATLVAVRIPAVDEPEENQRRQTATLGHIQHTRTKTKAHTRSDRLALRLGAHMCW